MTIIEATGGGGNVEGAENLSSGLTKAGKGCKSTQNIVGFAVTSR